MQRVTIYFVDTEDSTKSLPEDTNKPVITNEIGRCLLTDMRSGQMPRVRMMVVSTTMAN